MTWRATWPCRGRRRRPGLRARGGRDVPARSFHLGGCGGSDPGAVRAARPGHFRGVCTVVTKLFNIAGPTAPISARRMRSNWQSSGGWSRDLDMRVQIVPCPTVREPDGLAMSSPQRAADAGGAGSGAGALPGADRGPYGGRERRAGCGAAEGGICDALADADLATSTTWRSSTRMT